MDILKTQREWMILWAGCHAYISPSSAKLKYWPASNTTMIWSWTTISKYFAASFIFSVSSISCFEGVNDPDGWLWHRTIDVVSVFKAIYRIKRRSTIVLVIPPTETGNTPSTLFALFRYITRNFSFTCIVSGSKKSLRTTYASKAHLIIGLPAIAGL